MGVVIEMYIKNSGGLTRIGWLMCRDARGARFPTLHRAVLCF
jgi:hypothetical protein